MKGRTTFISRLMLTAIVAAMLCACAKTDVRERLSFNEGWKFTLAGSDDARQAGFDDSSWQAVDLPHDWSIEGEFSESHPASPGGGALPGGIGWYRRTFTVDPEKKEKIICIEFDGVYRNSEVWINGNFLGKRPYGYSSFRYELTPFLHYGEEENILAVKVDNSQQPNSRWYSGSGIYRNVWLVTTEKLAVDHWGTYVTTPEVSTESAMLRVITEVKNSTGAAAEVILRTTVRDDAGRRVASAATDPVVINGNVTAVTQEMTVSNPRLWSVESPVLYRVVTEVLSGGKVTDRYETVTGIRSFVFDSEKGFILNGKPMKILGVCNHHDLGCLGAAVNTRAIERQLEILKAMGCNGIRTSHNPPAPELLDLCDHMGFIVMDEAFDVWKVSKTEYDYHLDFDDWYRRDLEDMVLRDRNHPSVFIWSIGNEVMEQWERDGSGEALSTEMATIVRALDDTRPVTAACNDPAPHNPVIASGALNLVGFNYRDTLWGRLPEAFPGGRFIGTETTSALATRGSYDMPSDIIRRWPVRWDQPFMDGNADLTCSAYDNYSAPWGTTHRDSWKLIRDHDFLSGMYIWTGFDYLGEPTPYWWPARSSYFGIIDLAGFPKDAYYMYQSEWTDETVLHLFPHWNWNPGQTVDVWAYTNCDEVELFLNDTSQGRKNRSDEELNMVWRLPFEEGTLLAVGYRDGSEVMRQEVKTAGEPAAIVLTPDRKEIKADGSDLSFITVTVVDSDNVPVPHFDDLITFTVEGPGTIAGVDNGSQTSMEPFRADYRRAFNGKCLLVVKAGKEEGSVRVTAVAEGMMSAVTELSVR
ncbi:MAG: beta-galactosidase GalB [Bacteroidales bacterium]|nr:beta-galactosidase GalB [Bacteroidales bacterium]MDT8374465.1 beta-galactosidase GalB [Bacteroidales bacterium]